jgi:hypothetical protein
MLDKARGHIHPFDAMEYDWDGMFESWDHPDWERLRRWGEAEYGPMTPEEARRKLYEMLEDLTRQAVVETGISRAELADELRRRGGDPGEFPSLDPHNTPN